MVAGQQEALCAIHGRSTTRIAGPAGTLQGGSPLNRIAPCLGLIAAVYGLAGDAAFAQTPPPVPASPSAGISPPRLGGYVQIRESWEKKPGLTGLLNRVRLAAEGRLPERFRYRVMVEFEASGTARTAAIPSLRDAYVRWALDRVALQAGQFKTPFSNYFLTSITAIETLDRPAVVDTLATKRDLGVMAEGSPLSGLTLSFGVFNGEGQNLPVNRDSTVLLVARAVGRPFSQLQVGASGASYGGDSTRLGLEGSVEERGMLVRGEW